MAIKKVTKYSNTVTSQANPNSTPQRIDWIAPENAIGYTTKTYARGEYNKKKVPTHYVDKQYKGKNGKVFIKKEPDKWKTVYNHAWTLASSDFRLDLQSYHKIKSIRFEVRMRKQGGGSVKAPIGNFRIGTALYNKKFDERTKQQIKDNTYITGWNNGMYIYVQPRYLSTSFDTYAYVMPYEDVKKAGHTYKSLNQAICGLDLYLNDGNFKGEEGTGYVDVEWIRIIVEYDTPTYTLSWKNLTASDNTLGKTESNPYSTNDYFTLRCTLKNDSSAKYARNREVTFNFPWGWDFEYLKGDGTYDPSTRLWTVPSEANSSKTIDFKVLNNVTGATSVTAKYGGLIAPYYLNGDTWIGYEGYGEFSVTPLGEFHKRHTCCLDLHYNGISEDDTVTINFSRNKTISNVVWSLNTVSEDIAIVSSRANSCTVSVPPNEQFDLNLRVCFKPLYEGSYTFTFNSTDFDKPYSVTYDVLAPYTYRIGQGLSDAVNNAILIPDEIIISNHRVLSDLETGDAIIPLVSDDVDSVMIMDRCRLSMTTWDELDYIGCVPLEHLHFDPKSTYKDTLLNSTYKNKRYMGKKLATDEDITLNVRLHPQQVTTIQGLIDMDKPIPINANHKCFEGDSLNHRGWAEIYGIKTELTNPRWYKCDIDVKYLTHNLNTRFEIIRAMNNLQDYQLPSVLAEVFSSGDNLSEDDNTESTGDSFFVTETDGTFYYNDDSDSNDYERNLFSIDNGQHIYIKSRNPLSNHSTVSFSWSSELLPEIRENNISRMVKLVDKMGNSIFEYQYDNIEVDDDEVTADVIYRVRDETNNMDAKYSEKRITFRYELANLVTDDDAVVFDESDVSATNYGTTLDLRINNGLLSITDKGFNGQEIKIDNIKILNTDYTYVVEWINNNADAESNEIGCVFDFTVQDTFLTTTYSDMFRKMVVSPFPVSDKRLLFTREAEEGTIYYYYDDGEEFSYLIEPFFQYLNGTDFVTRDGISIFNLNYGYDIIYIQNGLVRLGFNRLNGYMYLGKFDPESDTYITTHRFHLLKYDDINVNSISDDMIEIQASDSTFTIYRGHPYIKIKHDLEDIVIDTVFNRVWSEKLNNDVSELPVYYDLFNNRNLLPSCLNEKIDSDCVDTSIVDKSNRTPVNLTWNSHPSSFYTGTDTTYSINQLMIEYSDDIEIDGGMCSFGEYAIEIEEHNYPRTITNVTSSKEVVTDGEVTNLSVQLYDYFGKGTVNRSVKFYKVDDLVYFNDGTNVSDLDITSGATVTVEDDSLKMTTSTSGEKTIAYPFTLTSVDNFIFECEVAKLGSNQSIGVYMKNPTTASGCWVAYINSSSKWGGGLNGSSFSNVDTGALTIGDKFKIKQENGVITLYHNDAVIYSKTTSLSGEYTIGHYTNRGRIQYIKNIKLRMLDEDNG